VQEGAERRAQRAATITLITSVAGGSRLTGDPGDAKFLVALTENWEEREAVVGREQRGSGRSPLSGERLSGCKYTLSEVDRARAGRFGLWSEDGRRVCDVHALRCAMSAHCDVRCSRTAMCDERTAECGEWMECVYRVSSA
jgi:hypothetical protein